MSFLITQESPPRFAHVVVVNVQMHLFSKCAQVIFVGHVLIQA